MFSFRAAVKNDYKAIAMLHAKSWQQNYRGVFSDHFLDNEVLNERCKVWKERLQNPKGNQFIQVVEIENSIVAFVCVHRGADIVFGTLIDNLHVDSRFIGQGIGEKLMLNVARAMQEKGGASMYLWVLTSNAKAIRFYERMGGSAKETINDLDIGDREITKTRYYWPNLNSMPGLNHK